MIKVENIKTLEQEGFEFNGYVYTKGKLIVRKNGAIDTRGNLNEEMKKNELDLINTIYDLTKKGVIKECEN